MLSEPLVGASCRRRQPRPPRGGWSVGGSGDDGVSRSRVTTPHASFAHERALPAYRAFTCPVRGPRPAATVRS